MTKYRIVENELGEYQVQVYQAHIGGGNWKACRIRKIYCDYGYWLKNLSVCESYIKQMERDYDQDKKRDTIKRVVE